MKRIHIDIDEDYPVYYCFDLADNPRLECMAEIDDETFERWQNVLDAYANVQFEIGQYEKEFYDACENKRNTK